MKQTFRQYLKEFSGKPTEEFEIWLFALTVTEFIRLGQFYANQEVKAETERIFKLIRPL